MSKNIVLITSAIHTNYGIYSTEQRIQQTTNTVLSARKHIPNATIILIDNSKIDVQSNNSEEFNNLIDAVDYYIDNSEDPDIQYFHNNVVNYDIGKNSMECIGMLKALSYIKTDEELTSLVNQADRIIKLSGRYEVTDKFNINTFDNSETKDKYVFKKRQASWIPSADTGVDFMLQTRLYSFTPNLLANTIKLFEQILENMLVTFNQQKYIDIEHSMAKFIPSDQLVEVETVGLQGNIAPNGMMIID